MKYIHTNIISENWQELADFYVNVFQCEIIPPIRHQEGSWLARGTGVPDASLQGVHLKLPGYDHRGPTLEIYSYGVMLDKLSAAPNRQGLGHLAFEVHDVTRVLRLVESHGGQRLGQVTTHELPSLGTLTFVYCCDPDQNIIELQNWRRS